MAALRPCRRLRSFGPYPCASGTTRLPLTILGGPARSAVRAGVWFGGYLHGRAAGPPGAGRRCRRPAAPSNFQQLNSTSCCAAFRVPRHRRPRQKEMRARLWMGRWPRRSGYPGAIFLYFRRAGAGPLASPSRGGDGPRSGSRFSRRPPPASRRRPTVGLLPCADRPSTQPLSGPVASRTRGALGWNVITAVILVSGSAEWRRLLWLGSPRSQ